jgi:hypothetical protein
MGGQVDFDVLLPRERILNVKGALCRLAGVGLENNRVSSEQPGFDEQLKDVIGVIQVTWLHSQGGDDF